MRSPSTVTSLAARRTLGDLQAGRSYVQRVTPAYLNSLISKRVTASRMSLRSSTYSLMQSQVLTLCARAALSACVLQSSGKSKLKIFQSSGTVYRRIFSYVAV